jgi:four helix bundle protein
MRRAAIPMRSNIAEGSPRRTEKDQANFCTTAYCSLVELLNQLIISFYLDLFNKEKHS